MVQNWETPELVILVQGQPDERVLLTGCKGSGQGNNGPSNAVGTCTSGNAGECCSCHSGS